MTGWTIRDDERGDPVEATSPHGKTYKINKVGAPWDGGEVIALINAARAARETVRAMAATPAPPPESREEIERELRKEWWLNHGCPIAAAYGDDGEMQCNASHCWIDFKRMPLDKLRQRVQVKRGQRLAAAIKPREEIERAAVQRFARELIDKIKALDIGDDDRRLSLPAWWLAGRDAAIETVRAHLAGLDAEGVEK